MPVRVRALYTRFPHLGGHSGMRQLLRHLDPAACVVRPYAVSDGDADLPLPHPALRRWLRDRVQRRGMAWYKLSDLAAEARALGASVLRRTDVVHFLDAEHSAQYLPALLRKGRLNHVRTVGTYHQPPEALEGLLDRTVVACLDHVILVSPAQEPYFRELVPPERVEVVLYGVDTDFFRPGPPRRAESPFRCITAGHWLRDWKALRGVAERLASRRDIEFHIVTSRVTGLEGLRNVRTHRDVDDTTLVGLYQNADLLLLPLTQATANNTLLEGIACGLPVVSSDLPSIRAYLPGGEGLLVKDNHPGQLAEAVVHLKEDPGRRRDSARRARARAKELSWPRIAPHYERIYTRLQRRV